MFFRPSTFSRAGFKPLFIPARTKFTTREQLYKHCYRILGVEENADQNTCRRAYLDIVKRVHPDSGHAEADADRFHQVDSAFKTLQAKFAKARRGIFENMEEEVKIFDIKHTAPQHRQYLSYDGFGVGSMSQREKQHQQRRAMKAQERVLEHRVSKAQAGEGALMKKGEYYKRHAIKTKYGFDRVVEDLIQEGMSRGDFQNLRGAGKPLPDHQSQNPYVDFTTHKLNKILIDNGFTPEWIMLQKEIREHMAQVKAELGEKRSDLGPFPLSAPDEELEWAKVLQDHDEDERSINKKIDKFNLIVPILEKQMTHISLAKIANDVLRGGKFRKEGEERKSRTKMTPVKTEVESESLINVLGSIFGR